MTKAGPIPEIIHIKKDFINKVLAANFNTFPVSEYSKVYLGNIQSQIQYITDIYAAIVLKALEQTGKSPADICAVDYGGGSGLLSVFSKMCGIKKVIYNDIYEISCRDVVYIARELGIELDEIIQGDIENIADKSAKEADILMSMDVIEHIYDLENFFSVSGKMNPVLAMVHYTGANMYNPIINRRLKKQQLKVEYKGIEKKYGHKERDTIRPFFDIRKEMIRQQFPEINGAELNNSAELTRGLCKNDIIDAIAQKIESSSFEIKGLNHQTNTCDPYTGNWEEHLLSIKEYKTLAEKNGFSLKVIPSLYNTKQKSFKIYPLYLLNNITKVFKTLFTAPGFYLTFTHKK